MRASHLVLVLLFNLLGALGAAQYAWETNQSVSGMISAYTAVACLIWAAIVMARAPIR
jgi:hypothetical protein